MSPAAQRTAFGVAWCAAQWLVVSAYRIAPPSVVGPLSYSQMLWAGILGWAVFGLWPDTVSLIGMGIIALSAAYAAWGGFRLHSASSRGR